MGARYCNVETDIVATRPDYGGKQARVQSRSIAFGNAAQ